MQLLQEQHVLNITYRYLSVNVNLLCTIHTNVRTFLQVLALRSL
jgi:hypothetical protein